MNNTTEFKKLNLRKCFYKVTLERIFIQFVINVFLDSRLRKRTNLPLARIRFAWHSIARIRYAWHSIVCVRYAWHSIDRAHVRARGIQ